MATILTQKRTKVLPLSYIKYLPMAYSPSFFEKASEILKDIEEEGIVDSIAAFRDQTQEFLSSLEKMSQTVADDVIKEFGRIQSLWRGVKHLFKAYATSYNANEATLGKKALGIYQRLEQEPMRRTNAAVLMQNLVNGINRAWTPSQLTGSFLESWVTAMTSAANDYAAIYQDRVERAVGRSFFTDYRERTYEAFEFAYLSLYTFMGNSGDLAATQMFSELNDLIATYTAISKGRSTRIANKNAESNASATTTTTTTTTDEAAPAPAETEVMATAPASAPEQEEEPVEAATPSAAGLAIAPCGACEEVAEDALIDGFDEGDYEDWDD